MDVRLLAGAVVRPGRQAAAGSTGSIVLLLCALAGVGYVALYSAGRRLGRSRIATRHALRFALGVW